MQSAVLESIPDPSLRAFVTWVPVLPDDGPPDDATVALVSDGRASHFWDPPEAGHAVREFARVLDLPESWPAWDVYLLYGPDARWGDGPPAPAYWEHQLGELASAPQLDGERFAGRVRALLGGGP